MPDWRVWYNNFFYKHDKGDRPWLKWPRSLSLAAWLRWRGLYYTRPIRGIGMMPKWGWATTTHLSSADRKPIDERGGPPKSGPFFVSSLGRFLGFRAGAFEGRATVRVIVPIVNWAYEFRPSLDLPFLIYYKSMKINLILVCFSAVSTNLSYFTKERRFTTTMCAKITKAKNLTIIL